MANFYTSPNMQLTIPVPGVDPGPDWANNLNASLTVIDSHTHSPGSGVQITPSGIDINSDLTWNNTNNAINLRSLRFFPQGSPISGSGSDLGCLYESGVDLYFNDGAGNQIRITQSGSVAGASGTITGLPSGTASAAYASINGTFVFQQATSTAANLDVGSIAIRYPGSYPTPSGNYIQLRAPSGLSSGYSITLPSLPAANNTLLTMSTSGVLSAAAAVDNSTLEISSGVLQVKASGIGSPQIADGAVTPPKLSASNHATSASTGSYSNSTSSFTTAASVVLTTSGRPVLVSLAADGSSNGQMSVSNNTGALVRFKVGSNVIGDYLVAAPNLGLGITWPGNFSMMSFPSAGANTFLVQAEIFAGSGSVFLTNLALTVVEI